MRPAFNMVAMMAALALGSCALLFNVQQAIAEPQPGSPSRSVPAARQSSDKSHIAQARNQVKLKAASARPKLAPASLEPLYLSKAYFALLFSNNVQKANAEPQPGPPSRSVPAARQSSDKSHIAQARSQVKLTAALARTTPAPPALEPPLYLSEAYLKKEQQTEDRLKRVMNICSGC
jgi:hypothetical protein